MSCISTGPKPILLFGMTPVQYIWQPSDFGQRFDKVLSKACSISRTQMQEWIHKKCVTVDGQPVESLHAKVSVGSVIDISPPPVEPSHIEPCEKPLDIIYEDEELLVLNKQAGDVVHPGAGVKEGTLVSSLLHYCKGQLSGIGGVERPGIVHRLDKDTSGALIIAKTDAAHQGLVQQFQARTMEKFYIAYTVGKMRVDKGEWTWGIARHPIDRHKMRAIVRGGRISRTGFQVQQRWAKDVSLVELRLHTGRTHQIRVHASAAGLPVVGDLVYGKSLPWMKDAGITRQLLHAHRLAFQHPVSDKTIEIEAPLPEDFERFRLFLEDHKFTTV